MSWFARLVSPRVARRRGEPSAVPSVWKGVRVFAALGRVSYRHRRIVVVLWLALFVCGAVFGTSVFTRSTATTIDTSSESATGASLLTRASPYGESLIALVAHAPADGASVNTALTAAGVDVARLPGVANVAQPGTAETADLRSVNGQSSLIVVNLAKDLSSAQTSSTVTSAEARLTQLTTQLPGSTVKFGGTLLVDREIGRQVQKDTLLGELIALPITLVVLVVIFGGFVAASIPLLGALGSVAGALLALLGFSHLTSLDSNIVSVTTVLGLGLSIDYALLMVSRYREERCAGLDPDAAIERTVATAGRTIAFSALTVATSLAGLLVFDAPIFRAVGAAGLSVVVIALLAAMTLCPALLAMFGRKIKVPDKPDPDDGFYARVTRQVQRFAIPVTIVVAAGLLLAGSPFLGVKYQNGSADLLPASFQSRQVADAINTQFPAGATDPVTVVAKVPAAQLQAYADALSTLPGVAGVQPAVNLGDVSYINVLTDGTSQSASAQHVVNALRADRPDFTTWVTGDAASLVDFTDSMAAQAPLALGLVVLATFVLLFLMTGSVLVPIKALAMNVLSLGASLGALVLIFQNGWLSSVLGFTPTGGLQTWIPVIVFAFAFGLSMDYEVFLLARIKELHDAGVPHDKAVELGIQRSAQIITSAALLMVIVFAGFASGQMLAIKQMGIALALAVAVDATLVRGFLVPATMTILGEANWWAPHPMRRFHRWFNARIGHVH